MATIVLESFIPAKCWMAPEIPTATYNSGATILPVCPTCISLGTNPASTAAREAPTPAPSLSAKSYSILKLSPDFIPRPPEIILDAAVSSGLSDLESSWLIHEEVSIALTSSGRANFSVVADPDPINAFSKAVPLTVITLTESLLFRVWTAFPA